MFLQDKDQITLNINLSKNNFGNSMLPPPPIEIIRDRLNLADATIEWLAGDGSDRCYYRIKSAKKTTSMVLMQLSSKDAACLHDHSYDWIKIANILKEQKISGPSVIQSLPDFAALVIDDYGDITLEWEIKRLIKSNELDKVGALMDQVFAMLANFIAIPRSYGTFTRLSFDREKYTWELNFFKEKFLIPVAGIIFTTAQQKKFNEDVNNLADFLHSYSKYFTHRDFHSRNLMFNERNSLLSVIDFQDARLGPASYDLISICFDSYIPLEQQDRLNFLQKGMEFLKNSNGAAIENNIAATWKTILLQRQLKAIGSFGYLTIDKNKGNYLKNVGPALGTLQHELIYDERWPFLSGELMEILRKLKI